MNQFFAQLVNGLTIGSTYALVALGIVLIFSVLDVMSVAQGEILLVSAYVGFVWAYNDLSSNLLVCSLIAVATSIVVGALTEVTAVRPALRGGHLATLISTVGVGLVLANGVQIIFGQDIRVVPNDAFAARLFDIAGVGISRIQFISVFLLVLGFVGLKLFTEKTRAGVYVRAVSESPDMAAAMGINVSRVRLGIFATGSALAGLASVLLALKYGNLTPEVGIEFSLIGLTAAIIGGSARVEGAVIAAFALAITQTMATAYIGADFSNLVGFAMLFLVLLVRPEGIYSRTQRLAG